ncbi:hypothetical protein GTP41_01775 [Pseudoduganella sp. DS3]|uniref:Uncharacterized protein n=1 Tax=Pseudoduganella guangdongensis TaxID=2692179 RepID=A0A6N9HBI8_9BURK|nr:hypothetical protein [Pseudoduganella guangdongensis]MYN00820.1 hypothetical protein [Pseudoduganella guangdongensis]
MKTLVTMKLRGIVFASAADEEFEDMAHIWMRDAETAYWFSLSRSLDSNDIEVMVSDQLNYRCKELNVTLSRTGLLMKLNDLAARAMDGHLEYAIEFAPDSQTVEEIKGTLEVIFKGKSGLLLDF